MDETLKKSLIDLIDETIVEIEEMKKSRFAASEIEIKGPGADALAGKPVNGKLDKEEEKKEIHVDIDSHKDEEDEDEKDEAKKGENEEAAKAEDMDKKEDKDEKKKDEKDKDAKGGEEHEAKERKAIGELADLAGMKKSMEEQESLLKSYVDQRMAPIETKLSSLLDVVSKLADQPAAPRGFTSKMVPLAKSSEMEVAPLNKSEIASKLFELKKSGTSVDSLDITKVEMGQELQAITKKYNLQ